MPGYDARGLPAVTDLLSAIGREHDVRVVALRHPPPGPAFDGGGFTVHRLGASADKGVSGRTRVLAAGVRAVLRLHAQRPFDVLHALWADEAGVVAVLAGRLLRRRVMVSVMGGELVSMPDIGYGSALGRGGRWSVRLVLRGAHLVTCGSSILHDALAERVPASRLRTVPLGVDLDVFSPRPAVRTPGQRTVLSVGSLEPVKDHVTLLRAFAVVSRDRRDAQLRLVGHGALRSSLERLAERLGIAGSVEFLGRLPRDRLPDLYRSATILCVSSRHEAQSMAAVEAAACGLPIVGTRVGCLPDLGDGARTVPVGDHRSLAAAMSSALDDPEAQHQMGGAARAAAIASYEIDAAGTLWSACYTGSCSDRRGGARGVS